MKFKPTKPGLSSIFLWVLSFILALKIQPSSHDIWVPDALLLFGFCPLLIARHARWLWLAFGICNMLIGWTLVMSTVIPDATFDASHALAIKKHLQLYHPFMVWLLIGFISTGIGAILLLTAMMRELSGKFKKSNN